MTDRYSLQLFGYKNAKFNMRLSSTNNYNLSPIFTGECRYVSNSI